MRSWLFFFQAEDGIRDLVRSRGLGDVYKRQVKGLTAELRGAEQSWQWVEKARRENAQQVANPVGSSDSVQLSIGGTSVAEPPGDASWNRRLVIGLSAAVAVALAVVLILLT